MCLGRYNSLPRHSSFHRESIGRSSVYNEDKKQPQYFVSRSSSEFNLSGVGDLAVTSQKRKEKTVTFEDEAFSNFSSKFTSDVFM